MFVAALRLERTRRQFFEWRLDSRGTREREEGDAEEANERHTRVEQRQRKREEEEVEDKPD